jgi:hypothetical protein
MELKMFIRNKMIDSIGINPTELGIPSYLYKLQLRLEERNEEILEMSEEEPEFFMEGIPSKAGGHTLFIN